MSGLYNMIFGTSQLAPYVLHMLGKKPEDFGRIRDAFISNGYLQVYTRCGGGNRESCQHVFDEIAKHPLYSHNADDDYDTTYCTFFFNIPDEYKEICKDILDMPSTSERWKQALEAMSDSINK